MLTKNRDDRATAEKLLELMKDCEESATPKLFFLRSSPKQLLRPQHPFRVSICAHIVASFGFAFFHYARSFFAVPFSAFLFFFSSEQQSQSQQKRTESGGTGSSATC
jgi:hypothetical protein